MLGQEIDDVLRSSKGIMPGVECLPQLLPGYFALRHRAAAAHHPQSECRRLLHAEAADGFGLTGKADVGAHRSLTGGAARAVDAFVGPSVATRRTGLHRNIFGHEARWDGEFGRCERLAASKDGDQRERKTCNDAMWPHPHFPNNARPVAGRRARPPRLTV